MTRLRHVARSAATLATGATIVLAALVLIGSGGRADAAPTQEAEAVLGCDQRNQSRTPRRSLATGSDIRIGVVAFHRLGYFARTRTNFLKNGNVYVLKTPLFVAAGRTVTVSVAPGARGRAALFYRRGAFPQELAAADASTKFVACARHFRAGSVGVATEFGGGFVVTRPGCVPLEVWVDGASSPLRRRVPVGVSRC